MSTKTDITKRAIQVFNYLLENGITTSQRDFCRNIEYHHISFAQVLRGERDMPLSRIKYLEKVYNINPDYLLEGKSSMFIDNKPPMRPIGDIKRNNECTQIKRELVTDIKIVSDEQGTLIYYTTIDGQDKIFELVKRNLKI